MRKRIGDSAEQLRQTLLRPINPAVIVVLGIYTVVWGIWIMSPWWAVFPHAAIYGLMAKYGTEYIWGAIAVAAGTIIIRGALKPVYSNIEIGAWTSTIFWLVIAIFYFIGDWHTTGWLSAACFCIYSAIIWVNIRVNRKYFGDHME
jgi:hypothetical protein